MWECAIVKLLVFLDVSLTKLNPLLVGGEVLVDLIHDGGDGYVVESICAGLVPGVVKRKGRYSRVHQLCKAVDEGLELGPRRSRIVCYGLIKVDGGTYSLVRTQ